VVSRPATALTHFPVRQSVPRPADEIDWSTPIDRSRWFICETVTPLYHTPIYASLALAHRRRYNQLTAMFGNELIAYLEREFLDVVLAAVARLPVQREEPPGLRDALKQFRDDERSHLALWDRLNRLSDPARYPTGASAFLRVPPVLAAVSHLAARYPLIVPVVFWMQLVQEERSVEISRRCLRVATDRLEPRYRAVYRAHLRDEIRHVRIDTCLIEWFYAGRSRLARTIAAGVFRQLLAAVFLAPGRSTARVVAALEREYPELGPTMPEIRRQLRYVAKDPGYQRMMYSRDATPITFALLDRFPEFARLRRVLLEYSPARTS
jgi:hypothetical protein